MKSKLIAFLLLSASFAFAWAGSGTYEEPYEINTASDVADLVEAVKTNDYTGKFFLQTADIDLSSFGNFEGIGGISADRSITNAFSGTYDGNGYWLSNMYSQVIVPSTANHNDLYCRGFFNYIYEATLENISVQGYITSAYLKVRSSSSNYAKLYVGGVVGNAWKPLLAGLTSNVRQEGFVEDGYENDLSLSILFGGVVGRLDSRNALNQGFVNLGDIDITAKRVATICGCVGLIYKPTGGGDAAYFWQNDFANHGNLTAKHIGGSTSKIGVMGTSFGGATRALWNNRHYNYGKLTIYGGGYIGGLLGGTNQGNSYCDMRYGANYGDIEIITTQDMGGSVAEAFGVQCCLGSYMTYAYYNTNYGNIRIVDNYGKASVVDVSGLSSFFEEYQSSGVVIYSANYGNLSVVKGGSNSSILSVGGSTSDSSNSGHSMSFPVAKTYNFGNIVVSNSNPNCSATIGGIFGGSKQSLNNSFNIYINSVFNAGDITYVGSDNASAKSFIGGVIGIKDYAKEKLSLSNSYSVGAIKWKGNKLHIGGVASVADADLGSTEAFNISRCYSACQMIGSTNGNYVGAIVGHADDTQGSVCISNCFAITERSDLNAIGYIGTNVVISNVQLLNYSDVYHTPSLTSDYLYNYAFTSGDRETNKYYDLTLPINKLIFPTITEAIRKKHTYTDVMGFKRYVKTNRK